MALPYIAQTMQKGAEVVLLQEVIIRKGTTVKVRRELRQMFPMYECYITAGSHVNVGSEKNDRTLVEEYERNKAQITVVLFLHKRHDNVSISIVNVHQATARRHEVGLLLRAMIDAALTQRRIMGGDFNAALSRDGYAQSTSALYDKLDKFFQDFVHSTHGTLMESEAHTSRDLLRGSSASLDTIITWNLTCTNTCTMQSSTSKVHWVGAECNDHALIWCTVGGELLTYCKGQVVGGRPCELKLKKIDPKQLPRIQSKLDVIASLIAQETRRSYTAGECSAEQAMVQMIAVRVTTARNLMHEKPELSCFDLPVFQGRGPHRSREQVRILKEVGTLKSALISVSKL